MRPTTAILSLTVLSFSVLVLAAFPGNAAAAEPEAELTTVVLVRHAEKEQSGDDPPLTAHGRSRAQELAHVLGGLEVDALYSTPFARTRQTAAPLAAELGVEVVETPVPSVEGYVAALAAKIRGEHRGDVVVVVGHSNTTPLLIRALGAEAPEIPDGDYDNLFLLLLPSAGEARLLPLRYGAETPPP